MVKFCRRLCDCFPSCYVMYTCISSANKIIYANKTIDIMKVIEMFTFFRSFWNFFLCHTTWTSKTAFISVTSSLAVVRPGSPFKSPSTCLNLSSAWLQNKVWLLAPEAWPAAANWKNTIISIQYFCLVYREQLLKLHVTIPMSKSTESQVLKGSKCLNHHNVINLI